LLGVELEGGGFHPGDLGGLRRVDHFQSDLAAEGFLNNFCDSLEEFGPEYLDQPDIDDLDRLTAEHC
jgi:hypothetical protein